MISSAFGITNLLVVSLVGAGTGLPVGLPPAAEDPVMAKVAPEECLAYISWSGSAAPDESSKNHLEQLIAEPEIQAFLVEAERLVTSAIQKAASEEDPEAEMMADLALKWGKKLLYQPAAIYLESFAVDPQAGPDMRGGAIVNFGEDAAEFQKTLGEMLDGFGLERVDVAGVKMHQFQPAPTAPVFTLGVKDNYFYLGIGKGAVEGMLERAQSDAPAWLADFREKVKVERASLVVYANAKEIVGTGLEIASMADPDVAELGPEKILEAFGLDGITSVGCVSGLDASGHLTRFLVGVDGELRGLLKTADGKPLTAEDLSPIPSDATLAVAARLDAAKLFDTILEIAGKIDPRAPEQIQEELEQMEGDLGMSVRDMLASLGDAWCIYHSTGEGGYLGGLAATVTVKERDTIEKLQKKFAELIAMLDGIRDGRGPKLRNTEFAGEKIYYITGIDRDFPLAPSWCVTGDRLIVSLFPQNIKAFLGRGDQYRSIATVPQVAAALESSRPIKLYYQDTPRLFEHLYSFVLMGARLASHELKREGLRFDMAVMPSGEAIRQHLKPDVIAVSRTAAGIEVTARECFPGSANVLTVAAAGAAAAAGFDAVGAEIALSPASAREMQSTNNLKMIGLAMHNYHDTYGKFPPAYSTDEEGKPLLSWRVLILPFVDEGELYERFKHDQPWDSEHNLKLLAEMPRVYMAPGSTADLGKTNYVTVRQKDSPFPGKEGIKIRSITDGTSNTLMAMEVSDAAAVTWSKPDDFVPPMVPAAGITGLRRNGFLAVACDGAVHKVRETIDPDTLKNLFSRNDGNVVDWDDVNDRQRRAVRFEDVEERMDAVEAVPEFDLEAAGGSEPAGDSGRPSAEPVRQP